MTIWNREKYLEKNKTVTLVKLQVGSLSQRLFFCCDCTILDDTPYLLSLFR